MLAPVRRGRAPAAVDTDRGIGNHGHALTRSRPRQPGASALAGSRRITRRWLLIQVSVRHSRTRWLRSLAAQDSAARRVLAYVAIDIHALTRQHRNPRSPGRMIEDAGPHVMLVACVQSIPRASILRTLTPARHPVGIAVSCLRHSGDA